MCIYYLYGKISVKPLKAQKQVFVLTLQITVTFKIIISEVNVGTFNDLLISERKVAIQVSWVCVKVTHPFYCSEAFPGH